MPSRVEHSRTADGESLASMFQLLDLCQRGLKILFSTEYADQGLHNFLEIAVQVVGIFSVFPLKRCQHLTFRGFNLCDIERCCASSLRVLGCCHSGPAAENQ